MLPNSLHMNMLLLLGLAIFGGTVGARLFKRIRFPQVVGYIVIGLLIGESGLKMIAGETLVALRPFNFFALGIIGFMIGGELKLELFRKYGRQFVIILLAEALAAFVMVGFLTTLVTYLATGSSREAVALGLLLGAISSATAPAATVDVLWEYRSGGPLTTTVLAIVALDDGLALMLYGLAAGVADSLLGTADGAAWGTLLRPLYEILGAVVLGVLAGFMLNAVIRKLREPDNSLTFTIGVVVTVIGLTLVLELDLILAAMCLGMTLVNLAPRRSRSAFGLVEKFAPPIYVLFFVLVGARLALHNMAAWVWALALAYVVGRTVGKMLGARMGARWGGAPETVRRFLGLCLFSQAGVAIGLSILAGQHFTGDLEFMGRNVIIVVTASTFIVQLVGPPCVKLAIDRAGETRMNITVEDLIRSYSVKDVMERKPAALRDDDSLAKVLKTFSEHDFLSYPVVDGDGRLVGLISFQQVRNTLATRELDAVLLAQDLMEPPRELTTPDAPLREALERMRQVGAEHMPVVASQDDRKLVGFLDRQLVMRAMTREIIRRREKAHALTGSAAPSPS